MNNRSSRNRTDTVVAGTLQSCKKNWLFDSRRRRKKDVTAKRGSPGGRPTARRPRRPHTIGRSSAEPPPKGLKSRLACASPGGSPLYRLQATETSHGRCHGVVRLP